LLKLESFPLNDDDHYYDLSPGGSVHRKLIENVVERALYSQSVKKPPGPAKLSFGTVRLLWKWEKEMIVDLAKAILHAGRHPAVWK
jgi:hypothetical protein